MALAMSTGKNLDLQNIKEHKQNQSNVITGFGYALDDIFENEEIDMSLLQKKEVEIESQSPYRSPKGSTMK